MNISPKEYSSLLSVISTLISLDKARGIEITFDKIPSYIYGACAISKIELDDEAYRCLENDIEYEHKIRHTEAGVILNDYEEIEEWYRNDEIAKPYFWERYRRYLIEKSSIDITSINLLDEVTLPNIMNYLGNPNELLTAPRLKRGLIIGDVQSGKTATYSGLICKAADAGYKVVILLAGITENLRQQTQQRIDEGVVGLSWRVINNTRVRIPVGVGLDGKNIKATSMTSIESDFVGDCDKIATTIDQHNSLVLFVIKKNVSVLQKLYDWLKDQNVDALQGCIDQPMLLIDDEADNASVNTKRDQTDPTKTNKLIRQICNLFKNATYVGFTATPFANVFIDPDSADAMGKADLFPEHFIYSLPTPSNYVGAKRIFDPSGDRYGNLRFIPDIEEPDYTSDEFRETEEYNLETLNSGPFYYKHKKTWHGILPDSLRESMICYFIANVIRDLRGDRNTPRSMLINMSRFVKVQRYIRDEVESIFNSIFNAIRFDFHDIRERNIQNALYKEFEYIWHKHFANVEDISFNRVIDKQNLISAIEHIQVVVVNGSKNSGKLDYKTNKSLRVIAVGGLALSRGLTLEGLIVSYFYRNTSTFDVLMQMGRWFGYRRGYEDVFQIWTSRESAYWYAEISAATEELKDDIHKMFEQKLTPKDFGLKVRDYCAELQITAANKMRSSYNLTVQTSFYGNIYDTPYTSLSIKQNTQNWEQTRDLVAVLKQGGYPYLYAQDIDNTRRNNYEGKSRVFTNVPKDVVVNYLQNIQCSLANINFNIPNIIEFLQDSETEGMDMWDIVFEGGSSEENYDVPGLEDIKCVDRAICASMSRRVIQVSSRRRLLGLREGKFALTKEEIIQAERACRLRWINEEHLSEREANNREIPLRAYFEHLPKRKPLLIIMLVHPKDATDPYSEEKFLKKFREELGNDKIVTFAIGFPGVKAMEQAKKFKVNKTYYQQHLIDEAEGEEDEE
ncbi:MAG: DEAD/DEAH box helicase family protein [Paludibacteraceae bacterium]|nr:DEAD/DEAH box helicase family protein [Paludibacteraceae bacterium]